MRSYYKRRQDRDLYLDKLLHESKQTSNCRDDMSDMSEEGGDYAVDAAVDDGEEVVSS